MRVSDPANKSSPSRRGILVGLFLALATMAVYSRVVTFDFVNFDDGIFVYENERVAQGLTASNIARAFSTTYYDFWHPLTWVSHMAVCQFLGQKAASHHLVNVLFHAANTLFLF